MIDTQEIYDALKQLTGACGLADMGESATVHILSTAIQSVEKRWESNASGDLNAWLAKEIAKGAKAAEDDVWFGVTVTYREIEKKKIGLEMA